MSPRAWRSALIGSAVLWALIFGLVFGCRAAAHQSVIAAEGLRTWTHGDHANDPVGVAACVQNRHGLTKCITHNGGTYRFSAPYPQVPANPVYAGHPSLLTTVPVGYEFWWVKTGGAICVYDWRAYLPPVPGREDFRQVACLGPDDTSLTHPFDVGTDLGEPPPDFIRAEVAASPPSLVDPNPFLERHGLYAELVPFTETTEALSASSFDGPAAGRYSPSFGVKVKAELHPVDKMHAALHEWLHGASMPAWDGVDCEVGPYCQRPFLRWYEEGLVEATTLHLLPGYARWLLGRPLRRPTLAMERANPSYQEAFRWLRAASRATGTPRWSRANREWLVDQLRSSLDERAATLTESGPAATRSPGAETTP